MTQQRAVRVEWYDGDRAALVEAATTGAGADGADTIIEATAAADIGNLRFYQRCGFRFSAIERDAFIPATGYPDQIVIDGIPLRDRVSARSPCFV